MPSRTSARRISHAVARGVVVVSAILQIALAKGQGGRGTAEEPRDPSGLISGQVVAEGATDAVATGFVVRLRHLASNTSVDRETEAPRSRLVTTRTDGTGRFTFGSLSPGRYDLTVTGDGFLSSAFGHNQPSDVSIRPAPLELRAGQQLRNLLVRVWKLGKISGMVSDDRNEPIVKGELQAFQRAYSGGRRMWTPLGGKAHTDDRGYFEISRLRPGEYAVALLTKTGNAAHDTSEFQGWFYGGTRSASAAAVISLSVGEERADVYITATDTVRATGVSLAGQLVGPGLSRVSTMTVRLVPSRTEDSVVAFEERKVTPDRFGRFVFRNVTPGEYELQAWTFPEGLASFHPKIQSGFNFGTSGGPLIRPPGHLPAEPTWVARQAVNIRSTNSDVVVPIRAGATIGGQVQFAGGTPPPPKLIPSLGIVIRPAHGRELGPLPMTRIREDGRFDSIGLPDGEYMLGVWTEGVADPALSNVQIASVRLGTRELAGLPIELSGKDVDGLVVTLARQLGQISGAVRRANGQSVPHGRVIVFPADRVHWQAYLPLPAPRRLVQVIADDSGVYHAYNLLPGEYVVAARLATPEFWMAPDYLQELVALGRSVSIGLGEARTLNVGID